MKSRRIFLHHIKILLLLALEYSVSCLEQERQHDGECGVYLAESTIPNSGLGMYAGKDYYTNDVVTSGDIVIPLVTVEERKHNRFLWNEYIWEANDVYME